jgi:diguanylate cyclase (GGDEF)-like protein
MYTFANSNKRFKGLKAFAFADLSLFIGFLLKGSSEALPQFLPLIAANIFIALAFHLYYHGCYRFFKKQVKYFWLHLGFLIVFLVTVTYFSYFVINENYQKIALYSYTLIESSLIVIFLMKESSSGFKREKLSVSYGFLLFAIYSLCAIIWTSGAILQSGFIGTVFVQNLFFIILQLMVINSAFSLIWIANSELNEELEERAKIDPLTKVLNRRAFNDELSRELARSKRKGLTFSLIMADIDFFKAINDNYGHLAGDSVLISLTQLITKNLRINDLVARIGGEEFIIILPDTNKIYARDTAERIRAIVEERIHPFNGKKIHYTVSWGVTSYDIDAQNQKELLEKVDAALNQAKSDGRNRVSIL